jgi:hypothetical protein
MAVHPDYPELTVDIVVEGSALQEYPNPDPEPSPKAVTKYVEATSGAKFSVRWNIPKPLFEKYGVRACIRLDGVDMIKKGYRYYKNRATGVQHIINSSGAYIGGVDMGQDFQFSKLDTCECSIDFPSAWAELK